MLQDLRYGLKYLYAKTSKGHAADEADMDEFVFDLLQKSKGLAFGEIHGAYAFPRFVKARMQQFADRGVKVLFVEFVARRRQNLLDQWQFADNPKPLIDCFNALKMSNSTYQWLNYWQMIEAAREVGIRVYGLDPLPEEDCKAGRMAWLNSVWMDSIKRVIPHLEPDEKYMIYGGQGHFRQSCDGARGVTYDLGIPAIQLEHGQPLLVKDAVGTQEHIIRIPLGDDHISFFKGPAVRNSPIPYPE